MNRKTFVRSAMMLVAASGLSLAACKSDEATYRPQPRTTTAPTYTAPSQPTYSAPAASTPAPKPSSGQMACGKGKCG
ncbi:MAG: hypothetical protein IT460_00325 [Planctomycetes bacterium]|nr:hypothetical protein [Planctomycetota bacterium]